MPDQKRYLPTTNSEVLRLVDEARRHNSKLDAIDATAGFASPGRCGLDEHLRTVICALACALETREWHIVAEGLAMLQDAELRARA